MGALFSKDPAPANIDTFGVDWAAAGDETRAAIVRINTLHGEFNPASVRATLDALNARDDFGPGVPVASPKRRGAEPDYPIRLNGAAPGLVRGVMDWVDREAMENHSDAHAARMRAAAIAAATAQRALVVAVREHAEAVRDGATNDKGFHASRQLITKCDAAIRGCDAAIRGCDSIIAQNGENTTGRHMVLC